MSDYVILIPARRAATRLPDKPLRPLAGRALIAHVVERARRCLGARVVLAVDDPAVAEAAGEVEWVLTDPSLPSGSDRIAAAAQALGLDAETIVVNLQGDEPFAPPEAPPRLAGLLRESGCAVATLARPIKRAQEIFDPDCVKVVCDRNGRALYFSRAPIPWARDHFAHDQLRIPEGGLWLRHIGIYAYRAGFLAAFARLPISPLERIEALEQLRMLEAGEAIAVGRWESPWPAGVDNEADLARAEALLRGSMASHAPASG